MAAVTLQEKCEETIILELGDRARRLNSNFSCGGSLPQVSSATIFFKKEAGEWCLMPLNLPSGIAEGTAQEFFKACCPASFGKGNETVMDKSYRDAVKLEPGNFLCNFDIANTNIITRIATVMGVGCSIRAELYRLNVYSTGGHFKAHVDTPRSKEMFGSLVVCLPSVFTGGELVTRHQGHEVKFNWSSLPTATHWAAFFSDVEHEVYPVTSGHRITLTFNLYHVQPPQPATFSVDVSATPLYKTMSAALHNPHFMREGGTLGFFCEYKYVETTASGKVAWDSSQGKDPNFLKGGDMVIYQVAKSFGLSVSINPVCGIYRKKNEKNYILPKFGHQTTSWDYDEDTNLLQSELNRSGDIYLSDKIKWCGWSDEWDEPAISSAHYGNEISTVMYYQAAALLIEVPKYSTRRGHNETSDQSEKDMEL